MESENSSGRTTTFLVIWLGQVVSLVGSGLTSFALGVWVFEQTGSATQFALIGLSACRHWRVRWWTAGTVAG